MELAGVFPIYDDVPNARARSPPHLDSLTGHVTSRPSFAPYFKLAYPSGPRCSIWNPGQSLQDSPRRATRCPILRHCACPRVATTRSRLRCSTCFVEQLPNIEYLPLNSNFVRCNEPRSRNSESQCIHPPSSSNLGSTSSHLALDVYKTTVWHNLTLPSPSYAPHSGLRHHLPSAQSSKWKRLCSTCIRCLKPL